MNKENKAKNSPWATQIDGKWVENPEATPSVDMRELMGEREIVSLTGEEMTDKIYPISYEIVPGNFTKEHLEEKGLGGCDALILHSIIYQPNGVRDETLIGVGPNGDILKSEEVFKSWVSMASSLIDDENLPPNIKKFCIIVVENCRKALGLK